MAKSRMQVGKTRLADIGTCHTCRLRMTPECPVPNRPRARPEMGCTIWRSDVKGQIDLRLEAKP